MQQKNVLLKLALGVTYVFTGLMSLSMLIGCVVLVHWHIDREFYSNYCPPKSRGTFNYGGESWTNVYHNSPAPKIPAQEKFQAGIKFEGEEKSEVNRFTLSTFQPHALYILFLQTTAVIIIWMLIFSEIRKVIQSVFEIETFRNRNVLSFKKIGRLFLILFFLHSFTYFSTKSGTSVTELGTHYNFTIYLYPLICALAAFILAQIFHEGNKLKEESQLTI